MSKSVLLFFALIIAACGAPERERPPVVGAYIADGVWTACHDGNRIYTYYQQAIAVVQGGCAR